MLITDESSDPIYTSFQTIETEFPEVKFKTLIHELGYTYGQDLSPSDIRLILIASITSFLKGTFSSDDLAGCAFLLCDLLHEKSDPSHVELHGILIDCTELSYSQRRIPWNEKDVMPSQHDRYLRRILGWYFDNLRS